MGCADNERGRHGVRGTPSSRRPHAHLYVYIHRQCSLLLRRMYICIYNMCTQCARAAAAVAWANASRGVRFPVINFYVPITSRGFLPIIRVRTSCVWWKFFFSTGGSVQMSAEVVFFFLFRCGDRYRGCAQAMYTCTVCAVSWQKGWENKYTKLKINGTLKFRNDQIALNVCVIVLYRHYTHELWQLRAFWQFFKQLQCRFCNFALISDF